MATGDIGDMRGRLFALLPPWFPTPHPILHGALSGIGDALAFIYSFIAFAKLQTRIATATGGWLDLIAWDYFAGRFIRRQTESDNSFRPRILQEILRPRDTRLAITRLLTDLTGNKSQIIEPWNTGDCGSYGTGTGAYGFGLGRGSLAFPFQIFVTVNHISTQGVANIAGYSSGAGGYGQGGDSYIDMSEVTGPLTDAEIYQRIAETKAAGVIPWTALTGTPVVVPTCDRGGPTADTTWYTI